MKNKTFNDHYYYYYYHHKSRDKKNLSHLKEKQQSPKYKHYIHGIFLKTSKSFICTLGGGGRKNKNKALHFKFVLGSLI